VIWLTHTSSLRFCAMHASTSRHYRGTARAECRGGGRAQEVRDRARSASWPLEKGTSRVSACFSLRRWFSCPNAAVPCLCAHTEVLQRAEAQRREDEARQHAEEMRQLNANLVYLITLMYRRGGSLDDPVAPARARSRRALAAPSTPTASAGVPPSPTSSRSTQLPQVSGAAPACPRRYARAV